MYGSETVLGKEKERSIIRAVQIDNLRDLLGIRRMNRVPDARIRELCEVMKRVDERCFPVVWSCGENGEIGCLREFMYNSVLVVAQWGTRERDGLIL